MAVYIVVARGDSDDAIQIARVAAGIASRAVVGRVRGDRLHSK